MQSFIYDKYGYDIKIIDNDTFIYENWVFKIINIGELETVKVVEYINFINYHIFYSFIICLLI